MVLEERYILHNGVSVPKLALGTWFINNKNVVDAVKSALEIGYRHIDTAQAYRNEAGVGKAIAESDVPREEIFVTTKLDAGIKSYKKATEAINKSLKRMGLDYIDMMIIHSPQPWTKFRSDDPYFDGNRQAWLALEEAYKAGKLKAIGLSNFEKRDIDNIMEFCHIPPMVNQVLAHIGNTPHELIQYSERSGMIVEAYSPIGHGVLMNHDEVASMASKYAVSVPQLSIRYCLQLGLLPLPKTSNPKHMRSNADVDFKISEEDMEILKNVEEITDYGDANIMPVYGGKLNLKSMFKMVVQTIRQ